MRNREVELKFALAPDCVGELEAHPLIANAAETDARTLTSTYFDTPDGAFRKARAACRIRESEGRRVLTVKLDDGDATARHEWECVVAGDAPDLSLLPRARLPRRLRAADGLTPVFRVEVERRAWIIARGASLVEAALDRGWISAGEAQTPVCELELELKEGEPRDLFGLARSLCDNLALVLDLRSKAQRGWALKLGAADLATKASTPPLDPGLSFADGFRALAQACLATFGANAIVLRATHEPEALHQTRTALRRLRALLRVYARHLRGDDFERVRDGLKWLSRALGAVRDIDVAVDRFSRHRKTAELAAPLGARRITAYARALADLDSARARLLLLDVAEWLSSGEWTTRKPSKISRGSISDVVMLEFHRWDARIAKGAAALADLDAEQRHKLRIRAKSLGYACELTAGLAPRKERKAHAAYLKALKALQSSLGDINDARMAQALLDDVRGEAGRAAGRRAEARLSRSADKSAAAAAGLARRFADAPRPWRA